MDLLEKNGMSETLVKRLKYAGYGLGFDNHCSFKKMCDICQYTNVLEHPLTEEAAEIWFKEHV